MNMIRHGLILLCWIWILPVSAQAALFEKVTSHPALDYFPAPSADGRVLAFVSERAGNADIWLKSLARGAVALPRQLTDHPAVDRDPALNRDGRRLLYVSHKTDPRGDIYLLDVVTGAETRLTDRDSGDALPRWDPAGHAFFYLKHDFAGGGHHVYRRDLDSGQEQRILTGVSSFSIAEDGWIVYSDGQKLHAVHPTEHDRIITLTDGPFIDLWPNLTSTPPGPEEGHTILFARYERDTNRDGVIDADDESSIWVGRWNPPSPVFRSLYRLTVAHRFHLYPAEAAEFVYFTDLQRKDIFRLDTEAFFDTYATFEQAHERATLYFDRGMEDWGLLTLTNISRNLTAPLSPARRAAFDFDYIERLIQAEDYGSARRVLAPYSKEPGALGARAAIYEIVLSIRQRAGTMSSTELDRAIANGAAELLAIGQRYRADEMVYGQALIEAGRLHFLANDYLSALHYLVKVDALTRKEIRARALFTRALAYRHLGDETNLLHVFIDVIRMFGEDSSWGRRAVTQAIAVSEHGSDLHERVAALRRLVTRYPELPYLATATRLRIADLYDEHGEHTKALQTLDRILADHPPFPALLERTYRRKAEILSASERYQEAASAYAALAKLTDQQPEELEHVRRLMVLQLVKKALKDRRIGEVRIAAKAFRRIMEDYPDSVEAHRGYIETKVMLDELAEVQAVYRRLLAQDPDNPVYLYGRGLALSYVEPPDLSAVIDLVEQAIERNPDIPYFHQTLGWAYEQRERLDGASGYLERAEAEYRIALQLTDGFLFPEVESNLLLNLGNVYLALQNYREAYRHYHRREQIHDPAGESPTELLYRKHYGEACFKTGRSEEAVTQYRLALRQVPADQPALQAELWERIGLAQQDLGAFAEAVEAFSEALALNVQLGNRKNLAILQRNIGVNLYNLSTSVEGRDRAALKKALRSYFAALKNLHQFGGKERQRTAGLFTLEIALGEGGSEAATGFDLQGEKKLMFSYIARTYEQLREPAAAREFYLKKLALLTAQSTDETDVALLTEKAVVLNRLGVLSYEMHDWDAAIEYTRQSLDATHTLGLAFGTRVNLYNVSRILAERLLAGVAPDLDLVQRLVAGLDAQLADASPEPSILYTLTNTAFLLHNLPDVPVTTIEADDAVQHWHTWYQAKRRAWSYYAKAKTLLDDDRLSLNGNAAPTRFLVMLNMLELARESEESELVHALERELAAHVRDRPSPHDWLWALTQAEAARDPQRQRQWLTHAFDSLLALPPQAYPRHSLNSTLSGIDRLSRLYVDVLVAEQRYDRAFAVAEQLTMRKLATALYRALGEDFFFAGLGDYEAELRPALSDLREALEHADSSRVEERSARIEDILFALYEEYPWAASYFWQYPPNVDIVAPAINADHPYLTIVPGRESLHGFLHDGTRVRYVPWPLDRVDPDDLDPGVADRLAQATAWYFSSPGDESPDVPAPLRGKPVTRVTSFYDFVNGYHERSLFSNTIAVAGAPSFDLEPPQDHPVTVHILPPDPSRLPKIIAATDLFVAVRHTAPFAFEIRRDLDVRDVIRVPDLAGAAHHTALVLNPAVSHPLELDALVVSLHRAGFPHVVLYRGPDDETTAAAFVSRYLGYLSALPADAAVARAEADVMGAHLRSPSFVLYGYAGMTAEDRADLAGAIYDEELANAVTLYTNDRFDEALHHIERALAVIDDAGQHQDFAELTKLAVDAAFKIGRYESAIVHQQRLLDSLSEKADPDEKAEALYRLGILYSRVERFDEALRHLQAAIDHWTQADELDRLADGIATLGIVRENMGAYSEALADFLRSFALYQEMGEIEDMAAQYRRIGRIYYLRLNRYARARDSFTAALRAYRELGDRRGEAETLFDIGLTYEKTGLFDEADCWYRQGRAIAEDLDDPFLMATAHLYLANTAWFRGQYQAAFESLSAARQRAEQAGDVQLTIMVKNTRGLLYWTLNDTDKALRHLKEAVTLAEQADIRTELASSLNNLGLIYRQRGEYRTALQYFEKARRIDEALNSRWGLGYDHRNIGMALLKLHQLPDAERHFLEAERLSAAIHNTTNWVKALLELGNVNRALDRPTKALEYYQRAFDLSQRYGIQEVEWRAAQGMARLLRPSRRDEALRWYKTAVAVVEAMRATLKIEELRNSFQSNKQDLYRETIGLLVEMGRTDEAFNYLERSRSRSFIDLLGNQKLTLKSETDQRTLDTITSLSQRVAALKRELASYDTPPPDLVERYRSLKAQYDEAVIDLKQQNPALSTFVTVDPLTLPEVQRLLEPGVGLLSYMLAADRLFIWLVRAERTTFYQVPVGEETVAAVVQRFRQSIQQLEPVEDELRQLAQWLIHPADPDLSGLEYLGIVPDGPLHFLAYSALIGAQGYLIERFPLFYTPSASVLRFTFAKRRAQKATDVLAIGNPDLGSFNYDLPLAELEAKSLRWNYPDMDILTGPTATKEWFIQNISRYGIIHLAAHGEFDELNPLFSSLWLASEQPENRRLTVTEIFGLEINADLVTLSACQTGLGKLEAGELIGLNRAFFYAGTHALVSALWRVDDLSTAVLMKHFYRNYRTMDKAKSLRQAQLLVKKTFPHPSYWAGFTLVGDYR